MSTSSSNNSNTSDKNDDVVAIGNPTVRVSSPTSSSPSSSPPGPDSKNASGAEATNAAATSPGGTSAFALYRDRAGSDSQHQNQSQDTGPSATSGSTFSSIAAGTAFSLSPSLIAGGSAAGFLTSTAAAISANNGICAPSQLTNTVSPLFGAPTSVSPSPVATAVANAINATSNTLITSTPTFVFGKGLFDRVTNGDNKDQESTSQNGTASASSETASSSGDGSGFVFGQNLSDRVINQQATSEEEGKEGNDNNGQAEPTLFQNATDQQPEMEPEVFGAAGNPALAQLNNADIVVSTGEEDERNVLQMNCKLYIYDKDGSNWIERGQGQLRLNDPARGAEGKSRIIIRTAGTLRVLLNTQIWEGIDLKIPNEKKCLRLVGRDELNDHKLHVFMIKCPSQDDVANLHRSIRIRLEALRKAAAAVEEQEQAKREETNKSTTKRIIPESDDSAPDSPAATSLPPSTKKAHLD